MSLPSSSRFPLPHPSSDLYTAADLIAAQAQLEEEAAEAVPFSFSHCTYPDGPLRQPLYACRTCLGDAAVCAACSVSCHGEHDLVELFVRREFTCDCGTERMGAGSCCSLRVGEGRDDGEDMERNEGNKYDKNFVGEFCWCDKGKTYDPETETDSMYQCLVCENWMHNECLQGFPSDSDLNPLTEDDFDLLICQACVRADPRVRRIADRYAGVPGSGVVLIDGDNRPRGRLAGPDAPTAGLEAEAKVGEVKPMSWLDKVVPPVAVAVEGGESKRKLEEDDDDDDAHRAMSMSPKKQRCTSPSPPSSPSTAAKPSGYPAPAPTTPPNTLPAAPPTACCAPPLPPPGHPSILAQVEAAGGRSNVWLEDGFYERWCRCDECVQLFVGLPFLLEEETSYDPPEDPEAHKTMEQLGMEALASLPRAQAIDGVVAFQGLSERLKTFLRPHADAGQVITEDLIKQFFTEEKDRKRVD